MKSVRRIIVTNELLKDFLKLPEGSEIVSVGSDLTGRNGTFQIVVNHPSFGDVPNGAIIPEIKVQYAREIIEARYVEL